MSKHKDKSTLASSAVHPDESKYIKNMAALLSQESGIEKDWIANILLLTKPQNLLSLIGNQIYKEHPAQILFQFRPCCRISPDLPPNFHDLTPWVSFQLTPMVSKTLTP